MIRHAGFLLTKKREERGLFASVTQSVVKENRPDISILNNIISGSSRDLIDVAITGDMGGSEHGIIRPPNIIVLLPLNRDDKHTSKRGSNSINMENYVDKGIIHLLLSSFNLLVYCTKLQ
jgi:hypothetical protein